MGRERDSPGASQKKLSAANMRRRAPLMSTEVRNEEILPVLRTHTSSRVSPSCGTFRRAPGKALFEILPLCASTRDLGQGRPLRRVRAEFCASLIGSGVRAMNSEILEQPTSSTRWVQHVPDLFKKLLHATNFMSKKDFLAETLGIAAMESATYNPVNRLSNSSPT